MNRETPFQTVGPYFEILLRSRAVCRMVIGSAEGPRVTVEGVLYDGAGHPIDDGLIEIWQADAQGRYGHPEADEDAPSATEFFGYGWCGTDGGGRFHFETIKPGPVPAPDGSAQAPHIVVGVMARGVLTRYLTRLYFADEGANDRDAILARVPSERRGTLIARTEGDGRYRFDIHLQGPRETVFFDV